MKEKRSTTKEAGRTEAVLRTASKIPDRKLCSINSAGVISQAVKFMDSPHFGFILVWTE